MRHLGLLLTATVAVAVLAGACGVPEDDRPQELSAEEVPFGLLTTASLTGLALSPILSGILGATSIRAVFVLDLAALITLTIVVTRLMVIAPVEKPTTPSVEEI